MRENRVSVRVRILTSYAHTTETELPRKKYVGTTGTLSNIRVIVWLTKMDL